MSLHESYVRMRACFDFSIVYIFSVLHVWECVWYSSSAYKYVDVFPSGDVCLRLRVSLYASTLLTLLWSASASVFEPPVYNNNPFPDSRHRSRRRQRRQHFRRR